MIDWHFAPVRSISRHVVEDFARIVTGSPEDNPGPRMVRRQRRGRRVTPWRRKWASSRRSDNAPPPLQNVSKRHAHISTAAGRREHEGRESENGCGRIDEAGIARGPIILFRGQAHTLIGAGAAGTGDAAIC
jgi:hypothetical protein